MKRQPKRIALECLLAGLAVTGMLLLANTRARELPPPARPARLHYDAVASMYGCERLFGLQAVRGVVHSPYSYESGMLGSSAEDDIDCLLNGGAQELVSLPGFTTDVYASRGVVGIQGSGLASCWVVAANGGHFCLLHLSESTLPQRYAFLMPRSLLFTPKRQLSGDEETALAVQGMMNAPASITAARFAGGFIVGHSGWPSSYAYSGGSCGDAITCSDVDAHLCIVLDEAAHAFFLSILDGQHTRPKPKPFNWRKKWGSKPHTDRHHHLLYQARLWYYGHQWLGQYGNQTWHQKGGYMKYSFQHGSIFVWIHHRHWKPKYVRRKRTP